MKKLSVTIISLFIGLSASAGTKDIQLKLLKDKNVTTRVEALYVAKNSMCKQISSGPIMPRVTAKVKNVVTEFSGDIKVAQKLDSFCKYELDSLVLTFKDNGHLAYNSTYIANYTERTDNGVFDVDCSYEEASKLVCYGDLINLDSNDSAEIRINLN